VSVKILNTKKKKGSGGEGGEKQKKNRVPGITENFLEKKGARTPLSSP